MTGFVPRICLFLALASLVSGFVLLAVGAPEPDMAIHRARIAGDETRRELLETQLAERQRARTIAIVGLFASAAIFTTAAFMTMGESSRKR